MHRNKLILLLTVISFLLSSCIKVYEPLIRTEDSSKYVVDAQLTDAGGNQVVKVSRTSSLNEPQFIPLAGCLLMVSDDKGNDFPATDLGEGNYEFMIDKNYLKPGTAFRLNIHTPEGDDLQSDWDLLADSPEIDSIYFERTLKPTTDPEWNLDGLQFYLDLKANESQSRFYRWEAIETYEYHVDYPREWWYDGVVHHISPPDYSRKVCWTTRNVGNIYTVSTRNLAENSYSRLPLQYVDNYSTKLAYGYSLEVRQYGLSEPAYTYWEQLRENSLGQGGLYEKQPLAIKSNIRNISNPESEVLGFFSVSSFRTKRIFAQPIKDLELHFSTYCNPIRLERGLVEIDYTEYPAFLMDGINTYKNILLSPYCVDCMSLGGSNIKPTFWPY